MQEKNNSEEAYYSKHEDHQGNKCKDTLPSFLVLLKLFVEKHDKSEEKDLNSEEDAVPRQWQKINMKKKNKKETLGLSVKNQCEMSFSKNENLLNDCQMKRS